MSGAATAIGIGAAVGGIGSIAGSAIGANAAGNAAAQQSAAANHAADLQYQASQNALGFQQGVYNNSQAEAAPWLQTGSQALSNLNYLLGNGQPPSQTPNTSSTPALGSPAMGPQSNLLTANGSPSAAVPNSGAPSGTAGAPGTGVTAGSPINLSASPNTSLGAAGSLLSAYPGGAFTAPTAEQAAQTPGYQFQLQQGNQALQQSAAARGNLLTGGTAEALDNYNQGLAASNYQNVYNNALQTYGTNYNAYQNQQANTFNRLASLAGAGQTAATTLGNLGQSAANGVSSNLLNTGAQIGQDYQNAGAANASGIVGSANALSGGIQGVTGGINNALGQYQQLSMLQNLFGGGGGVPAVPMSMYGG